MKKRWNFLGGLVLLLIAMFVWNENAWAAGEQENKGADKRSSVAVKQDNAQTTEENQTQQKKERITVAQKDTQAKQDETNNNKYYSATDELICGDVKIKSIARCPFDHKYPLWPLECEQKLFIGEKMLGDKPGTTYLWGCIQDRKSSNYYIVIDFYSGGNCWTCEWTEVYDLRGNLVMSDEMDMAKCTLPPRREKTPEGFRDEFARCPEKLIEKREANKKMIKELKRDNEKKMKGINFEKN